MNRIEDQVLSAKRPVALTGAGISAPSGIPTFQGTWRGRPIRDFLSRDFFEAHPRQFFELYCEMVSWCRKEPNPAHLQLAKWGLPIITQNIDGLHHKAGGKGEILELHGTLRHVACRRCGRTMDAEAFAAKFLRDGDYHCPCGQTWDTDVVLYGDAVRHLDRAWALAQSCDVMLVVGTSLTTYPAAALPDAARQSGARVIEVNDDCIGRLTGP